MGRFISSVSIFIAGCLIASLPCTVRAEGEVDDALSMGRQALEEGDTNEALGHLLEAIAAQQELIQSLKASENRQDELVRKQETQLDELQAKVGEQETTIAEQKKTIENYEQKLARAETATAGSAGSIAVDQYKKIEDLYQQAYLTRRTGIFDMPRRDAPPYFEKAIRQFRHIAETYPGSSRAPDAQFQVAKTYHRWLKDTGSAVREYKVLVDKWPESPFAREAREALTELGVPTAP